MHSFIGSDARVVGASRAQLQSYRRAHWCFLTALAVTVAGFWPSFFRRPGEVDVAHMVHGASATGWIVALAAQAWLMSQGLVRWHRHVAWFALGALLPTMVGSALYMVGVMQRSATIPPQVAPFIAFLDLPSLVFLCALVALAMRSRRRPAAHMRYMSATVLLGLPAALTRLLTRVLPPEVHPLHGFHASLLIVEALIIAHIMLDRRAGAREFAWPLSLVFFVVIQLLIGPISARAEWRAAMSWYAALPLFR